MPVPYRHVYVIESHLHSWKPIAINNVISKVSEHFLRCFNTTTSSQCTFILYSIVTTYFLSEVVQHQGHLTSLSLDLLSAQQYGAPQGIQRIQSAL